ncbi:unnamed protein product [Symbiodinium pilosum]|uniref:EF-hand domain-containing protein n=1 Tax=Symbiodinium pilosum TaxID=2952 RepID=A0A812KVJ9_SYMPI|nr:unnamed protein product [Symbiodinium pilosum]
MTSGDADSPSRHPLVVALRALLRVTHGNLGRATRGAVRDAAISAHQAALQGSMGVHDVAAEQRDELQHKLQVCGSGEHSESVRLVWDTLILAREAPRDEGLDLDEMEELVLAHLLAFPEILAQSLVVNLFQQVHLGQSFLHEEERTIDVNAVLRELQPRLEKHKATSLRIAEQCCAHLQTRSETLADKLLRRMDLDGDGFVGESEFFTAAVHALALEVENLAVSVGVKQLLNESSFADDFHEDCSLKIDMTESAELLRRGHGKHLGAKF